ncbi:putative isochorismatase family protein [Phaeomoniella chlamydospora]|uniref:Putative isochorismatase family protein n=1 Tax=Phaeomoniella chlamydospora TaxID=158046 RepID=A0A0G2E9L4_PHACM|nr:putative isochorismatase family protein [Phaeomoniella chlamydospora]
MGSLETEAHRKAIIGSPANFWLHSTQTGFDLTHPETPTSPAVLPRVKYETTTSPVTVDPKKTALVIIDMQNFFISPALGRSKDGNGWKAQEKLINYAIPAARKQGIRIIWLNWGLTEEEIDAMPPATLRAFGFETVPQDSSSFDIPDKKIAIDEHGINQGATELHAALQAQKEDGTRARIYRGLGRDMGKVKLEDGSLVDGGKLLMRGTWNAALTPELEAQRQEGLESSPPDVWIHKNRMSGLWGEKTMCTDFLEKEGIKTLIFSGVNTDQCVGGSLQDAFTKGWDCILLSDGAGTTSPDSSQQCIEFNTAKTWGFLMSCEDMAKATIQT